jgi:hypothetical protein
MKKRKITTQHERTMLVQKFLKSGQSQLVWCQTQDIAASTFAKWMCEYKRYGEKTKFVMLTSEETPNTPEKNISLEITDPNKEVLIEIGPCKIHGSEQMALAFMLKALEAKSADV